MKILHTVEFYHPSVGGAQEVVKQISEHLVALGHSVTVATTKLSSRSTKAINGVKIREFDIIGNKVRGYKGKDIEKYKNFLIKGDFDIIMNYAAQQWATDLMFGVLDKVNAKKILVPCGFSGLYDPSYKNYFSKLPSLLKKYHATVYLSNDYRDIDFARKNNIKNLQIIPNGADEREFGSTSQQKTVDFRKKYKIRLDELLILNVSNHTGVKGHKEAIQAFQRAKIKNATLMFIGDINHHAGCYKNCKKSEWINNKVISLISKSNKKIIIKKLKREDTITAFFACDFFLFLSNLECSPLVLFEAIAAGKPFISSGCGNSSEIAKWTEAGIIINSKQDKRGFTQIDNNSASMAIEKLANNKMLRLKLGRQGKKAWKQKFSWEKISKQYEILYKKLLDN
jgi:L-malate glycosyltransferase